MRKTIVITALTLILLAVLLMVITPRADAFNKQIFDFVYNFNYAYIELPNGKVVEGRVQKWLDFEDGDQLQIKIDDVIYLTDTTRAVLAYDPNL